MNKKVLKGLSIILMLILVIGAFAGCGPKQENTTAKQETKENTEPQNSATETGDSGEVKPESGAKLKLWMDNDDYNERIIEAFNEKYPDIEVTAEHVGTVDARSKLEMDGPTGMGADVFVQPHDGVALAAEAGMILENDLFEDYVRENFIGPSITATQYKGKLYGLPLTIKTYALFYNKELVEKPAETWDEIFEFAKTFNDPSKNKFTLIWQANDPYFCHCFLSGYDYEMFGPNGDDKDKLNWDTQEAIDGMKFYKKLHDVYPVAAQDATWDVMNSMFSAGEVPYVITGSWSIKDFREAGIDFGVKILPKLPNGKQPISFSTVDVACVSSFTKYPNAAKLFAKFMASEEGLKIIYETKGELPTHKAVQESDFIKADVHLSGIAEQTPYSMPMPFIPEMANVWDPYKKAFTAVWDGLQDPETALKGAAEEFYSSIIEQ